MGRGIGFGISEAFSYVSGTSVAPASLTATPGDGQIALSWSAVPAAITYNVYRGIDAGAESATPIATGIVGTSYTDTGLTNATSYYYTVRAVNAQGTGAASPEASGTPTSPLLTGVAARWGLTEDPGAAATDSVGSSTLTDQNNVDRTSTSLGAGAVLTAASLQRLYAASNSALTLGGAVDSTGWTIALHGNMATLPTVATSYALMAKRDDSVGLEYQLYLNNNGGTYQLSLDTRNPANAASFTYMDVSPVAGVDFDAVARYDPVAGKLAVFWNGTKSADTAWTTGTRSVGAEFSLGAYKSNLGFFDGTLFEPTIWHRALSDSEVASWRTKTYPYSAPPTQAVFGMSIDNTGGDSAVTAGDPLLFWLPATFPWNHVAQGNFSDLRCRLTSDHTTDVPIWPVKFDLNKRYCQVEIKSPAVAQGASVGIEITTSNAIANEQVMYTSINSKVAADGNTVALWNFDAATTSSAVDDTVAYTMTFAAAPTILAYDGGSYALRQSTQRFTTGKHVTFNGTSQYGTISGLLDTVPANGSISFWEDWSYAPFPGSPRTIFQKVNAESAGVMTEGVRVWWNTTSGQKAIVFTIITGGVTHEILLDTGGFPVLTVPWHHVTCSWGAAGMQLWINGVLWASNSYAGKWADGTLRSAIVGAGNEGGTVAAFAPVSLDQLLVESVQPSRDTILRRYRRGGSPAANDYEYSRWTPIAGGPAILTPTLTSEQGAVFEPRVVTVGPTGGWYMVYTGGITVAGMYAATSADGVHWTKLGRIIGSGDGGWAGTAQRCGLFNVGGTWVATFSTEPAENADIAYATSTDGITWAYQGVLMAHDGTHLGWANHYNYFDGSTWHWLCEYRAAGGGWLTQYRTSSSFYGPYTDQDSADLLGTTQQGVGNTSSRWFAKVGAAGYFHYFPHIGHLANLPSHFVHYRSRGILTLWESMANGDAVIDLSKPLALPLTGGAPPQDQYADSHLVYDAGNNRINFYCDADSNAGGTGHAAICLFTRPGGWDVLDTVYPSVH